MKLQHLVNKFGQQSRDLEVLGQNVVQNRELKKQREAQLSAMKKANLIAKTNLDELRAKIDGQKVLYKEVKDAIEKSTSEQHEIYLELVHHERIVEDRDNEQMQREREFIADIMAKNECLLQRRADVRSMLKLVKGEQAADIEVDTNATEETKYESS